MSLKTQKQSKYDKKNICENFKNLQIIFLFQLQQNNKIYR